MKIPLQKRHLIALCTALLPGVHCTPYSSSHDPICEMAKSNCQEAREYRQSLNGKKDESLKQLEKLCNESQNECFKILNSKTIYDNTGRPQRP